MSERVVAREGEEPTDWQLVVTETGDVVARRQVPFDGVLYFSTESRALPTGRRTDSQYGLKAATVVERFVSRASIDTPRHKLVDDVQAALDAVSLEGDR